MLKNQKLMARCLMSLGGAMLLLFMFIATFTLNKESSDLKENNKRMINVLSQSIMVTLKDYMVNADTDGLKNFFKRQKEVLGQIKDIKVVRKSGIEAFKDNKAQMQVEEQQLMVAEKENESFRYFQKDDKIFQKVLASQKSIAFEKGNVYIEVTPIVKNEECDSCHEYDSHPVLGVIVVENSMNELHKAVASNRNRLILFYSFSFIILLLLLSWIIKKQVVRPIETVTSSIRDIAEGEGDLTLRVSAEYQDEIGDLVLWFNAFVEHLQEIIKKITHVSKDIKHTGEGLAKTVKATHEGTIKQDHQTDQIASAMEEMSATVIEIARNTSQAAGSATTATEGATKGEKTVKHTLEGMNNIYKSVKESVEVVTALGKSSEGIGNVILVIEDIADQTNLLALNAAIEAARAGEYGRGFAVVADEVRKLSDRTTQATKEIAEMIKLIQSDISSMVGNMEVGMRDVEEGVKLAEETGGSFNNIMGLVRDVSDLVTQIAAATEEHSTASEEVTQSAEAIARISKETNQLATSSDEGITELNKLSEELRFIVEKFKL